MRQSLSGLSTALACASGSSGSAETIQALPGVQNSCYRGSRLLDGQCERDQYLDVGNSIKQVTRGGAWNASSGCRPLVCPRQVCARPEPLPQRRQLGWAWALAGAPAWVEARASQ